MKFHFFRAFKNHHAMYAKHIQHLITSFQTQQHEKILFHRYLKIKSVKFAVLIFVERIEKCSSFNLIKNEKIFTMFISD